MTDWCVEKQKPDHLEFLLPTLQDVQSPQGRRCRSRVVEFGLAVLWVCARNEFFLLYASSPCTSGPLPPAHAFHVQVPMWGEEQTIVPIV